MKTIQVEDEVYNFLKSCQEELNTQDVRGTANPIYGFIYEKEYRSDEGDELQFINEDWHFRITNTEEEDWEKILSKYILEHYDYDVDTINSIFKSVRIGYDFSESLDNFNELLNLDEDDSDFCIVFESVFSSILEDIKEFYFPDIKKTVEAFKINAVYYQKMPVMYQESVSLFESDMQAHLNLNKHNMPESARTYVYWNNRTPKMTKLRDVLKDKIKF